MRFWKDDRDGDKVDAVAMDVTRAEDEVGTTSDEVVAGNPIQIQSVCSEMVLD